MRRSAKYASDLFYPATKPRGAKPAPYFPDVDLIERWTDQHYEKGFLRAEFGTSYPLLRTIRTHSYEHATAAKSPRRFPVVVFSHGGGINVLEYTTLIEELASHGYVVTAVEHPGDAGLVVLPGGRVVEQSGWDADAKRTPAERMAFHRERHQVDARDNAFVLDQLVRLNDGTIASPLRGRIDLSHAFAIGHSLGGKASVVSCATDPRWTACVNLDGGLDAGDRYPRVDKPLLAIYGAPSPVKLPIESEEQFRARQSRNAKFLESKSHRELVAQYENVTAPGVIAYVSSPGFSHFAYYDLVQPEAEQWGATPERNARNLAIIRKTILAFLENTPPPAEVTYVPIGN
ncbi:MAG: isoform [Acidobacteria bacterium]|nr:isoform [Acidobacteriota bacterium]